MSDDDYQNLLDRVATSKDFAVVRDNILFFLQVISVSSCQLHTTVLTVR